MAYSQTLKIVATITAADGAETLYISLAKLVAAEGAITGTPTVVSSRPTYFAVSQVALNVSEKIVNGVTYAIGTLLTYRVAGATASNGSSAKITVNVITALSNKGECYKVDKQVC